MWCRERENKEAIFEFRVSRAKSYLLHPCLAFFMSREPLCLFPLTLASLSSTQLEELGNYLRDPDLILEA
jgi:hypothetical protein